MSEHISESGGEVTPEAFALLVKLAQAPADPQELASPDHKLLTMCETLASLRKARAETDAEWRKHDFRSPEKARLRELEKKILCAMRSPMVMIGRTPAATPAGLFAKAIAVRGAGHQAAGLGKSLAADLLANPRLRAALWPAEVA